MSNSPKKLRQGDLVALVAPAGKVAREMVDNGLSVLQSWGLKVKIGKHLFDEYRCYAGTDADRASDLQTFVNDPEVKAIICLRGGYGCVRLLEYIDFAPMLHNPKWLVGFSDITVLHVLLNCKLGIESLHATMPKEFHHEGIADRDEYLRRKESTESLREALFGQLKAHEFRPDPLNIRGRASGRLLGGNLAILQSLAGTYCDVDCRGAILFIEDTGESSYRIDRMMMNLVHSGKLAQAAGLLVGDFAEVNDESDYGKTAREIVAEHADKFGIPAAYGFPAGHTNPNLALYLGRNITLEVKADGVRIEF
ncbi:MAG: LD-carboxypeptidase [Prevotellaceae bacterium]|jgi:muramoyltetrapeptide carboxypeptidase|nr:LD-carboxypeptidase [Prevotellaceae bacterium]